MIKLVLFDLDGVLIYAKDIHYEALNEALGEKYAITREEHLNLFDGRKTWEKLDLLTELKDLPREEHKKIHARKQKITIEKMKELEPIQEIVELFQELKEKGFYVGICSNSVRRTVLIAADRCELTEHCDLILSNEDVKNPKPHPEMYWKAMSIIGVLPEETLIIEDSPVGLLSAHRSNAKYIRVSDPWDVTREKIFSNLGDRKMNTKWKSDKLNIVIPMAGAGSRFEKAGYTFPKPLIQVNGKPMIQVVVENLAMEGTYYFIVQREHEEKYNLSTMLNLIVPGCHVFLIDGLTQGAACTTLIPHEYIDHDIPLIIANSDQYVEWDSSDFMYTMQERNCDGGILTFQSTHPKWSFAKHDENNIVSEVAEKNPISTSATVGIYYWKKGEDYVKYANQMIDKNIRVNNEFYVCPVFNEAIQDGKVIRTYEIEKMWGLGTPEDLEEFMRNF